MTFHFLWGQVPKKGIAMSPAVSFFHRLSLLEAKEVSPSEAVFNLQEMRITGRLCREEIETLQRNSERTAELALRTSNYLPGCTHASRAKVEHVNEVLQC
jgi:hypothetical protein